MLHMYREERSLHAIKERFPCAYSTARLTSPAHLPGHPTRQACPARIAAALRVIQPSYVSMLLTHYRPRLYTIYESRPYRQHINRWRVWRGFEGLRGGRLGWACNARICNLAAPFHQCLTHGLPGLQSPNPPGERVSPERLAARHVGPKMGTASHLEAVPVVGPTPWI